MNLKQMRAAALKSARDLVETAKAAGRDLTSEENTTLEGHLAKADELKEQIAQAAKSTDLLRQLEGEPDDRESENPAGKSAEDKPAKSLGEHFVKHAHEQMVEIKGQRGGSASAPEFFKAAGDTHTVNDWDAGVPLLTDVDRTIVRAHEAPLALTDLVGKGTISGNAISYFVAGADEGEFKNIAEATNYPQLHFENPTSEVDALRKMSGYIDMSDEFVEDVPFLVSEVNGRLLWKLDSHVQAQLMHGDGTGNNLKGIFERGIQTVTAETEAVGGARRNANAVFHAMTKISTATGLMADGIVVHPLDYEAFRLETDENGQYMGGGFLAGPYGNGGILQNPPLWGVKTVVTPYIEQGTVLAGAFRAGATLYRKGGVSVQSTNSDRDKFTSGIVTIRASQRMALAVRFPLAFAEVTLDPGN